MDEFILGSGFGCITDIKVGPDGFVYVVSLSDGTIYRLVPKEYVSSQPAFDFGYLAYGVPVAVGASLFFYAKKRSGKKNIKPDVDEKGK